ncbi:hypothetical protein SO802_017837, partial [Lithocarpus litseifolius]
EKTLIERTTCKVCAGLSNLGKYFIILGTQSLKGEEDDDDMFFLLMFVENKNNYIPKEPQHISMLTVGHIVRIRVIVDHFQHSTMKVDRKFKETVKAICRMGKFIIHPSQSNEVHPRIANNIKFFPYFKKCIGAIDGTYINAWAPASKLVSYRNRKATITPNIMCACHFDMKFTFVYTG